MLRQFLIRRPPPANEVLGVGTAHPLRHPSLSLNPRRPSHSHRRPVSPCWSGPASPARTPRRHHESSDDASPRCGRHRRLTIQARTAGTSTQSPPHRSWSAATPRDRARPSRPADLAESTQETRSSTSRSASPRAPRRHRTINAAPVRDLPESAANRSRRRGAQRRDHPGRPRLPARARRRQGQYPEQVAEAALLRYSRSRDLALYAATSSRPPPAQPPGRITRPRRAGCAGPPGPLEPRCSCDRGRAYSSVPPTTARLARSSVSCLESAGNGAGL